LQAVTRLCGPRVRNSTPHEYVQKDLFPSLHSQPCRHVAGKASEGGRWKNGGTGTMLVVTFHIMPGEQADSV
ncbi:hypothetical protein NGA_0476100, partial [Nannochloropsis gaditana CCMP526]|uniref:uncharacterized protein n=1 Tax=Nannochloropsis gaditana (strain CCMP526) TaxID=1093141 RepID=UPI00029F7FE0